MAKLHLAKTSVGSSEFLDYPKLRIELSARLDVHGVHTLCDDPGQADVILFATNYCFQPLGLGLFSEPIYQRHRERCILFDSLDLPSPIAGGLCASWTPAQEALAGAGMGLGWCYHHPTAAEPRIEQESPNPTPRYLWSFKGSFETHAVRRRLAELKDAEALVVDTSAQTFSNLTGRTSQEEQAEFLSEYKRLFYDSAFVVCPRGFGASSMRIFEAMRAGRAPVIVSDAWTPPPFVDWARCSLRIAEHAVGELPRQLRARRGEAQALGDQARKEWERVFGETGLFHHTVEAALMILHARRRKGCLERAKKYRTLGLSPYRRILLRDLKNRAVYHLRRVKGGGAKSRG